MLGEDAAVEQLHRKFGPRSSLIGKEAGGAVQILRRLTENSGLPGQTQHDLPVELLSKSKQPVCVTTLLGRVAADFFEPVGHRLRSIQWFDVGR